MDCGDCLIGDRSAGGNRTIHSKSDWGFLISAGRWRVGDPFWHTNSWVQHWRVHGLEWRGAVTSARTSTHASFAQNLFRWPNCGKPSRNRFAEAAVEEQ
jgi:hypothetical protein